MLAMRKQTPALILGDYEPLHEDAEAYFAFLRTTEDQTCLVILNYSDEAHTLGFDVDEDLASLVISTRQRPATADPSALEIAPFEVYIAELH
jgi:glycosidase